MRIPRIYTQTPLAADTVCVLEAGPSQHIGRALRMRAGDSLVVFDGSGLEYPATIDGMSKKQVTVRVGQGRSTQTESALRIALGIGLSRGDRMDWIVQKATELGVAQISPLFTERTEVKLPTERAEKKLRHWQEIAISACEQCGRNVLPVIELPQKLENWLQKTDAERKFVLHHRAEPGLDSDDPASSAALLIGPEGGLGDAEIDAAIERGYSALRLGPRVLRTETAPMAAIAILQSLWGDMRP